MKFCFVCGKKTDNLKEGYCEDCYNKNFSLVKVPKEIKIIKCCRCGKIKQRNDWLDKENEDLIRENIKILGKDMKIDVNGNKVIAKGFLASKNIKEETFEVSLKIKRILCPNCSKKSSGYYESIIQLRGDFNDEILNFIYSLSKKTFLRVEQVKNGLNLYIGSENIANQIADEIKRKYKFKIKKSFKLYTKKEGRDVYRSTLLINCG